jgi:Cu2+-containing amine oxidase
MYVPYNNGQYVLDINGLTRWRVRIGYDFVKARKEFLPAAAGAAAAIQSDGYVIAELVDEGVRFMDNRKNDSIRRGQVLWLWGTLAAANYRYVVKYGFADDGTIYVRVGGTAENLMDDQHHHASDPMHVHMGAWRMEFDLGDRAANVIQIAERKANEQDSGAAAVHRPFNGNREGGEKWGPEMFTTLKIVNKKSMNRHDPPRNIGYKLVPARAGTLRTVHPYTHFDFWVTRAEPDDPGRVARAPELMFIDVPSNIRVPEPIADKPVVVWYTSGVYHMPRTEDFGAKGFRTRDGVALIMWTGFDLMPIDFWHKTPFLDR